MPSALDIFSNILNKILQPMGGDTSVPTDATTAPVAIIAPATPAGPSVDMEKVQNDMAARNPENLNWRISIVDLMKQLGLDSSMAERNELAKELGYKSDFNDSASMNIWLHEQAMKKVADNGGTVPADLKD